MRTRLRVVGCELRIVSESPVCVTLPGRILSPPFGVAQDRQSPHPSALCASPILSGSGGSSSANGEWVARAQFQASPERRRVNAPGIGWS